VHQLLAPDIIDLDLVTEMFEAAELSTERDEDGDLLVQNLEEDWTTVIALDDERSMLVMRSYSTFVEDADELAKLQLVNKLNRDTLLVRFYVDQDTVLIADTMLCYEGGLTAFQILRTWRWFVDVSRTAISSFDDDDIVE